jgi:sulfoxide reductase heme-binding subunit YedZ
MNVWHTISRSILTTPVWLVYLIGFIPAVVLFYRALFNILGADPLKTLEHELGEYALIFLIILLSFRPIKKLMNLNLIKFRRSIGLLAFWYAVLHFLTYIILDQQLIWDLLIGDLIKRPYIIVGVFAFLTLVPLALTSNAWSMRRFGKANWKNLHLLVYLSAILAALHYVLLVKSWPIKPLLYLLVITLLITFRFLLKRFL